MPGDAPYKAPRTRVYKMGKAFSNYRRIIRLILNKMVLAKRSFYRWRRAAESARVRKGAAESARLTAVDECWNDEDMNHFLSTAGSWDEHARLHQAEKEARRDRRHENHKKRDAVVDPAQLGPPLANHFAAVA